MISQRIIKIRDILNSVKGRVEQDSWLLLYAQEFPSSVLYSPKSGFFTI